MTWRPADELERLLNGLADGLLADEEEARLASLLHGDARARRHYRHWLTLHASLMWDYAAAVAEMPNLPRPRHFGFSWITWAAAVALVVSGLSVPFLWTLGGHGESIAWLEESQGTVIWTNGTRELLVSPGSRVRLEGGTIVLEGEASSTQVRFDDGTLIALNGDSEVVVSDQGQKRLVLRRGTLSAQVRPQPPGRPMVVRTPTAEVEVLGTVFALASRANETELNVDTGSVQLRRLADGSTVKVLAQQNVVASLAVTPLSPTTNCAAPRNWRQTHSLSASPSTQRGLWLPAADGLPGRMQATPFIAGRRTDGSPIIHHGVVYHQGPGMPGGFVSLERDTTIRLRYRLDRETPVVGFLSCRRSDFCFGGNFYVRHAPPHPAPDANGWRVTTLPLASAVALIPDHFPSLLGFHLRALIVHSIEADVGLEIASVEIGPEASLEQK